MTVRLVSLFENKLPPAYQTAIEGFEILHELFEGMCDHVFADELGDWMFTGDWKAHYTGYFEAASNICDVDEFAGKAMSAIIKYMTK